MKVLLRFVVCALAITLAAAQTTPDVFAVFSEFDRIAASPLWPGFEPERIPLEIFDGRQTWLVRHPAPPAEFHESPQHPGVFVRDGRDPSVQANTVAMLAGVGTATGMLESTGGAPRRFAAVMAHESFHVFQRDHQRRRRLLGRRCDAHAPGTLCQAPGGFRRLREGH